jgi:chromosome partitioning protein
MRESHDQATPLIYLAPRHKLTIQFVALFEELAAAPRR